MTKASLLAALLAPSGALVGQGETPPIIELRFAVTAPAPGHVPRQLADSVFYVSEQVLLSDADIVRADTSRYEGRVMIHVRLRPQAAARLEAETRDRIGDRVAVFFSGELHSAAEILSALSASLGMVVGGIESPKGDSVAAQVLARWPWR